MVREIHFVTGKGGAGKSLIAAALADKKSQAGQKTLLVELGEQSYFALFFGLKKATYEPQNLKKNFDLALWNGTECLKEYVRYLLKIEALYKLFFENAVSRSLINVAPALPELAILGKITSGPRKHGPPMNYDVIVVDAFATGHFLSLLKAPRGLAEVIRFGPMGEQCRSIDEYLFRKNLCHFHIVTLPEELSVQETLELDAKLKTEFGVKAHMVINKVVKTFLKPEDLPAPPPQTQFSFLHFLKGQLERLESAKSKIRSIKSEPLLVEFSTESQAWPLIKSIKTEWP